MTLTSRLDPAQTAPVLEAWLATRLTGAEDIRVDGLLGVQSSGFSTETLMFDAAWREGGQEHREHFAARVQPMGDGLFPDYDLGQEARLMSALTRHSALPVPAVRFFEADPSVLGAPFMVMDRVAGRTLADDPPFTTAGWMMELTSEERALLYDNMIAAIAGLHSVDLAALGLDHVGPPDAGDTPLDRELAYLERFAAFAANDEPDPLVKVGLEWLRANRPAGPEPTVLCWGDARFANAIFADDLSIAATLDWELATVGSPELDLGYFLYALHTHTEGIGAPLPSGFPSRAATIARYEELSGFGVAYIDYYETVAALRCVAVMRRLATMMIEAGFLPEDSDLPTNNLTTHILAAKLNVPVSPMDGGGWAGHRG